MREPPVAPHRQPVFARRAGRITAIDNRRIAKVAKLAGAPEDKAAGIELQVTLGDEVRAGQPLYVIHAESQGELAYAQEYATANPDVIRIGDDGDAVTG